MFTMVVDSWSGSMLHIALSFVTIAATAEVVVQETWISVMRGIGAFAGRSSLRTWVYRILINTAKRRGVRERRTVPAGPLALDGEAVPTVDSACFRGLADDRPGDWTTSPSPWPSTDAALGGELRAVIAAALDHVPVRQRAVLTLRDIDGRDAGEVCDILGITPGNQRVLLHRARATVRTHIDTYVLAGLDGDGSRP
jgi:RNA polymerase sigma-70 factor (ECF subfamily)